MIKWYCTQRSLINFSIHFKRVKRILCFDIFNQLTVDSTPTDKKKNLKMTISVVIFL